MHLRVGCKCLPHLSLFLCSPAVSGNDEVRSSDGLQPNSDGLQPNLLVMTSNISNQEAMDFMTNPGYCH